MQEATGVAVGADARETLKVLALDGALDEPVKVSCSALGDRLGVSTQTASRRLQALESADLIEREIVSDGQIVDATPAGERALHREYEDFRRIFESDRGITLTGSVTGGMGEGKHYISLPGYMRQFEATLGYAPYEGTLNVDLDDESVRARGAIDRIDPIDIDGWADDERTYGPAFCWPVTVEAEDETYEPAHLITPERTHHGEDQAELIAPDRLRDELGLEDGDTISIHVAGDA